MESIPCKAALEADRKLEEEKKLKKLEELQALELKLKRQMASQASPHKTKKPIPIIGASLRSGAQVVSPCCLLHPFSISCILIKFQFTETGSPALGPDNAETLPMDLDALQIAPGPPERKEPCREWFLIWNRGFGAKISLSLSLWIDPSLGL